MLLSDVDVVWLRDPALYLAAPALLGADVLVSSDCIFDFMREDQVFEDPYGARGSTLAHDTTRLGGPRSMCR